MSGSLFQAFVYLAAAVIAVPVAKRLGLGSVLGYLIAGIIIGPVIGLVGSETQDIQHFAEFGVVMMLFIVGLELEPKKLWEMRNRLIGLGGLQVGGTTLLFMAIGYVTWIELERCFGRWAGVFPVFNCNRIANPQRKRVDEKRWRPSEFFSSVVSRYRRHSHAGPYPAFGCARMSNKNIHIVARAKDRNHVYELYELYEAGANDIIRKTFVRNDQKLLRTMAAYYDADIPNTENPEFMKAALEMTNREKDLLQNMRNPNIENIQRAWLPPRQRKD